MLSIAERFRRQDVNMQPCATSIEQLIIFARLPEPGRSKTRLIPAFGAERASEIYRRLANDTLALVRSFSSTRRCVASVFFSGGNEFDMGEAFGHDLTYLPQRSDTLGSRLIHANEHAFSLGASRVVTIGTDCNQLTEDHLAKAFDALEFHDVVIGPATDGGYYLIGTNHFQPLLFEGIAWGTDQVFSKTVEIARKSQQRIAKLEPLGDVDFPEDVVKLRLEDAYQENRLFPIVPRRTSIIVPTLNEGGFLSATLRALGSPSDQIEVIVADGGSADHTLAIAQEHGCISFVANRGRARQMNAGAAIASGETLLFLHADTLVPEGYLDDISSCLSSGSIAGAFRLGIRGKDFGLRCVEWGANLRSRYLGMPYGDQGIFMRSRDFYALEGFKHLPIMEDFELVQRLRRVGKVGLLPKSVLTSSRRWKSKGILATTIINQICIGMYKLGFPVDRIHQLYQRTPRN